MDAESKVEAINGFAQEIVTEAELKKLFETNNHPIAYNGFEPSGLAPIHFGLQMPKNIKTMLKTGVKFKLYIADYFALINNKLGGNLEHIRTAGMYFVEVWKAGGLDPKNVEIVWCKDLMDDLDYWDRFMKIGKSQSLDRVKRAITIMGRKEGDSLSAAQIFYPIMQATDIFQMDVDICQLGMDQRKANILAREAAHTYKWKVPVAVHHPLLLSLAGEKNKTDPEGIESKMSKSNPKTAIFVHDSFDEIKKKINSAYCPEKIVDGNPMFDYIRYIILDSPSDSIKIERDKKFGGDIEAENYQDLVKLYTDGKIHPMDLKGFVGAELEKQIKPIRTHFEKDKKAKELYDLVKSYDVTR